MNFETPGTRAYEMLAGAESLKSLAEKQKSDRRLLSASIVLSVIAIEAYVNTLIWLKLLPFKDRNILKRYTENINGNFRIKRRSIEEKIIKWTKQISGNKFGNQPLIKRLNDLIKLRNQIVHYQIQTLTAKELHNLQCDLPYHLMNGNSEVHDPEKIKKSLKETFSHDYLRDVITLSQADEAIDTAKKVIAELKRCYFKA